MRDDGKTPEQRSNAAKKAWKNRKPSLKEMVLKVLQTNYSIPGRRESVRITFECTKCGYENYLATVFKNPKFFRGIIRSLAGEKNVFAQDQIAGLKAKFECSKCRCNNYDKTIDFLLYQGRKDRKLRCAS